MQKVKHAAKVNVYLQVKGAAVDRHFVILVWCVVSTLIVVLRYSTVRLLSIPALEFDVASKDLFVALANAQEEMCAPVMKTKTVQEGKSAVGINAQHLSSVLDILLTLY